MKILSYTDKAYKTFTARLARRAVPDTAISRAVADIIAAVRERGDAAVREFTKKFDGVDLRTTLLASAPPPPPRPLAAALRRAHANIAAFARRTRPHDWSGRNAQGATVGERYLPFDRVALYVPGGSAPLISTALMTVTLARVAGCREIVALTPPPVNPVLHYALRLAGATEIHQIGGAQAIAAAALGTRTIRPVQKIFGPGNKYVTEAKRQLVGWVAIDQLPGPSEVLVIADDTADPDCVAADLLAQAEHGPDSQALLLTPSHELRDAVRDAIQRQLASLSRADILRRSLAAGCALIHTGSLDEAVALANDYAAEHVSLQVARPRQVLKKITAAGAIFIGRHSPVAAGDFHAGPSHTLPTGGAAKSFSGLTVDQFFRRTSLIAYDARALAAARNDIEAIARAEQLDAHAHSVAVRFAR